jgi:hypothetical protein
MPTAFEEKATNAAEFHPLRFQREALELLYRPDVHERRMMHYPAKQIENWVDQPLSEHG